MGAGKGVLAVLAGLVVLTAVFSDLFSAQPKLKSVRPIANDVIASFILILLTLPKKPIQAGSDSGRILTKFAEV